jgi:hypothetical protein
VLFNALQAKKFVNNEACKDPRTRMLISPSCACLPDPIGDNNFLGTDFMCHQRTDRSSHHQMHAQQLKMEKFTAC